jgi:hypothetical protein
MSIIRASMFTLIATATLFCASQPAGADVGPLQMFKGGGVVAPLFPHPNIRLDYQEVVILLKHKSYQVDVVFNLFNEGENTTEHICFPKWVATRAEVERVEPFPTFINFEGSVKGERITFNEEWDHQMAGNHRSSPWKEGRQWLVSRITFPGNANTTIRVKYEAPYYGRTREASYIYGTGSLWKSNVGKAVFIVDATELGGAAKISTHFEKESEGKQGPDDVRYVSTTVEPNILRYEITDFEPYQAYLRIDTHKPPSGSRLRMLSNTRLRAISRPHRSLCALQSLLTEK